MIKGVMWMKRIVSLLLVVLLAVGMTACDWDLSFLSNKGKAVDPPDEMLESSLKALAEGQHGTMVLGADGTAVAMNRPSGMAALITQQLEFDIEQVETDGDSATAHLEITAPDMAALVRQALEGVTAFEETVFLEKLEQLLQNNPETKTFSVKVELALTDDGWCIVPNGEFSNAITGGLAQAYNDLRQSILDAATKGGAQE
jgi:hypothetical protein